MIRARLLLIGLALLFVTGCPQVKGAADSAEPEDSSLEVLVLNPLPQLSDGSTLKEIKMGIEFPEFPDRIAVYAVAPPDISREHAADIAQSLNVSDDVNESDYWFGAVSETGRSLTISKVSGTVNFTTKEWEEDNAPIADILTPDQYQKMAVDWLENTGLSRDAMRFSGTTESTRTSLEDGEQVVRAVTVSANFDHKPIGDMAFEGFVPMYSVFFQDSDDVIGVASRWREVGDIIANYPIISASEALERIHSGSGEIFADRAGQGTTVDSVELVYYSDSGNIVQSTWAPYYRFEGGKSGDRFFVLTPALRETDYRIAEDVSKIPNDYPRGSGCCLK